MGTTTIINLPWSSSNIKHQKPNKNLKRLNPSRTSTLYEQHNFFKSVLFVHITPKFRSIPNLALQSPIMVIKLGVVHVCVEREGERAEVEGGSMRL